MNLYPREFDGDEPPMCSVCEKDCDEPCKDYQLKYGVTNMERNEKDLYMKFVVLKIDDINKFISDKEMTLVSFLMLLTGFVVIITGKIFLFSTNEIELIIIGISFIIIGVVTIVLFFSMIILCIHETKETNHDRKNS